MSLLFSLLENISGKLTITLLVKDKEVVEISLKDKTILINVKNAFLALEMGLMQFIKRNKTGSNTLKKIKKLGYKIVVNYKGLKFEL